MSLPSAMQVLPDFDHSSLIAVAYSIIQDFFLDLVVGSMHSNATNAVSCCHYFIKGKLLPRQGFRPLLRGTVGP